MVCLWTILMWCMWECASLTCCSHCAALNVLPLVTLDLCHAPPTIILTHPNLSRMRLRLCGNVCGLPVVSQSFTYMKNYGGVRISQEALCE